MKLGMTVRKTEEKKPTRHYSKKQEDSVASKFEGQRVKNSGATMFAPGDVTLDQFLIECKTKVRASESMSIKKEWLQKNEEEALFTGKPYSALAFNFGPNEKNYYIIDEYLFETLINYLKENT